jgi:hypothetical protein
MYYLSETNEPGRLIRPGEVNDDHLYGHLNQVRQNVYANQGETVI